LFNYSRKQEHLHGLALPGEDPAFYRTSRRGSILFQGTARGTNKLVPKPAWLEQPQITKKFVNFLKKSEFPLDIIFPVCFYI
jgi:hypothetical protein